MGAPAHLMGPCPSCKGTLFLHERNCPEDHVMRGTERVINADYRRGVEDCLVILRDAQHETKDKGKARLLYRIECLMRDLIGLPPFQRVKHIVPERHRPANVFGAADYEDL